MIPLLKDLDRRIDTLETHGWAFETTTEHIRCWRYTARGRETLTITLNDSPRLEVTAADSTLHTETPASTFAAITAAETYMAEHPSTTDPARPY